jgi:hypothetical protein
MFDNSMEYYIRDIDEDGSVIYKSIDMIELGLDDEMLTEEEGADQLTLVKDQSVIRE